MCTRAAIYQIVLVTITKNQQCWLGLQENVPASPESVRNL